MSVTCLRGNDKYLEILGLPCSLDPPENFQSPNQARSIAASAIFLWLLWGRRTIPAFFFVGLHLAMGWWSTGWIVVLLAMSLVSPPIATTTLVVTGENSAEPYSTVCDGV